MIEIYVFIQNALFMMKSLNTCYKKQKSDNTKVLQ